MEEFDVSAEVKSLVKKAESATDACQALQFSQAACNSANAMAVIRNLPKPKSQQSE